MKILLAYTILFAAASSATAAPRFFISAPNVFHVGTPENVSVTVFGINAQITVRLFLQDYPHRRKTFSPVQAVFQPDIPQFLTVKVDPKNIPDQAAADKQYVYLVAKSDDRTFQFHKETKILLSFKDGVILIQTDKPIYTPKQSVKIRVIPLGFDLMPTTKKITVIVKNPQDIRVQQWKNLDTRTGFISKVLDLGDYVLQGNWTIQAFYGHQFIHNTSIQFEVREYVLPTFSVEIRAPPVFLRTDRSIVVAITSRYTHQKPVKGTLAVRIKIVGMKQDPIPISSFRMRMVDGFASITVKRGYIMDLPGNIWFPEGFRLQVEADVTESSTGITEHAMENKIFFSSSKYRIKFYKTARYFKPGLPFSVKAIATYPDDTPVPNIDVKISAKAMKSNGEETDVGRHAGDIKDEANRDVTGPDGQAEFVIDIPRDVQTLKITVQTAERGLPPNQNAVKELITRVSRGTEYLMLRQKKPVGVGKTVFCDVFLSSGKVNKLSYMVVSRGQILLHKVVIMKFGVSATISFQITSMMSPSARLVAYYMSSANGEVIADSILLEVHDSLPNQVQIVGNEHTVTEFPALDYTVNVVGSKGTRVGILGVDQSVYLLRNDNRLTPKRVFGELEDLDLGCGVGSGQDTLDVLKSAGIAVMTSSITTTERQDFKCDADPLLRRQKRSVNQNSDPQTFCCNLGNTTDDNRRSCIQRLENLDIPEYIDQELRQCRNYFLKCCVQRFGAKDMGVLARNAGFDALGDFIGPSDNELIEMTQVRSYFPETWIYEEKVIGEEQVDNSVCTKYLQRGQCGRATLQATLPDTITTWVVQAFAVSNTSGFGIAKPLNIKTFKPFFVRFTMPYSAQLGEQISILVTVYNFQNEDTAVKFYLHGNEGFCSAASPDQKISLPSSKTGIPVKARDSFSLPIPIVPIKYGEVPIKISVIDRRTFSVDNVEKKLLVVPEGVEKIKTQSYVLDPQGVLKDRKQSSESDEDLNKAKNTTFPSERIFDKSKNTQTDSILVEVPPESIPESIRARIYFTGNMIGPVVTNLIKGGLEGLLRMPTGCGEQTMIYMSPNVYVLQYLSNTRQVTANVEAKAYKFIQSGYQRELNYRRSDGSFSAWGERRPGSTWLTAFVLKVFCEASRFDGVQIDKNLVCRSVDWLVGNQRADGAFPEIAAVAHREMVGGAYQSHSDIAMTAFVVTALMECRCNDLLRNSAVRRAITFLENNLPTINGKPYHLALTTYALAMANSQRRFQANEQLARLALYNAVTSSRHWNAGGHALNIETAAYALLAQVKMNRLKYAGPIVIWLTEQKNSGGGFKSTTDTCVALQALAVYSQQTVGSKLNLKVTIRSELGRARFFKKLRINKENALLQQSVDILDYLGGQIYIDTVGTGVAQMQVDVRYNVPATKKDRCDFMVSVSVSEDGSGQTLLRQPMNDAPAGAPSRPRRKNKKNKRRKNKNRKNKNRKNKNRKNKNRKNKNKKKNNRKNKNKKPEPEPNQQSDRGKPLIIRICTQYRKPGKTGMSIVDVGLFTGYEVDKKSLKQMMEKNKATIANYELSQRSVVFYLDEIDSARQFCLAFKVHPIIPIHTVYPVPVKVYDYYEPDEACTTFYSMDNSSLVMGSCEGKACKCAQDKCTASNPNVDNAKALARQACRMYNYVIKVEVLLVDEQKTWLTYDVVVRQVIKKGTTKLKNQQVIELRKRGMCSSPKLKKGDVLLVMGRDKSGKYILDNSAFVKNWNEDSNDKLNMLVQRIAGRKCS